MRRTLLLVKRVCATQRAGGLLEVIMEDGVMDIRRRIVVGHSSMVVIRDVIQRL